MSEMMQVDSVAAAATNHAANEKLWSVVIDSNTSFKNAVEIISNVLNISTFVVEKTDDGQIWLRIDAMDSAQVAAVKMKLCFAQEQASGFTKSKYEFSVKIKTLLAMLKTLPNSESIEMYQSDLDSVRLVTRGIEWHEYNVKALNLTYDPVGIDDCPSDYTIEFEVDRLKKILACCQRIKANYLVFTVIERNDENILMSCYAEGDEADAEWCVEGNTHFSKGEYFQLSSREGTCNKEGIVKYKQPFDVNYLQLMFKSMERNNVMISLSSNSPLIIEYQLGQEMSSVRFLLAPHVESTD